MNYITFNEIIEVNGLLEEKGLNFKVHLRDACGKQSCWIELSTSSSVREMHLL